MKACHAMDTVHPDPAHRRGGTTGRMPGLAGAALLGMALLVTLPLPAQAQPARPADTLPQWLQDSPQSPSAQPAQAAGGAVTPDYKPPISLQVGLAQLSAAQKSKITPEALQRLASVGWRAEEEVERLSFALATGIIKALQASPEPGDTAAMLDFIQPQLAGTLAFNQPLASLLGSPAGLTEATYPAFLAQLYGPLRISAALWKRDLLPQEVSEYDAKIARGGVGMTAQFEKYSPDEKAWLVGFLNQHAPQLARNNCLNAETLRRLVLLAGQLNPARQPFIVPLGASLQALDAKTQASYLFRMDYTASALVQLALLTGQAPAGAALKLTTEMGRPWLFLSPRIAEPPHLQGLAAALRAAYMVDIRGSLGTALRSVDTDMKIAEAKRQSAEYRQQSAEADRQSAESKQRSAEADRQISEAKQQSAEYRQQSAEADRQIAEADRQIAEADRQTAEIRQVGHVNQVTNDVAEFFQARLKAYAELPEARKATARAELQAQIARLRPELATLAALRRTDPEYSKISTSVDSNLMYLNAALAKLGLHERLAVSP